MPSKTYDFMSAGLAIIGISSGQNNDLALTVEKYDCGVNIINDDYANLANAITAISNDKMKLNYYKNKSRDGIINELNSTSIQKQIQEVLNRYL